MAALSLVALLSAVRFLETGAGNIDDAFIVLVYARHLLATGTFFYNQGDGAVDGFTSLLDVLVKAAVLAVVPLEGVAVLWWLSLGQHVAIGVGAFLLARWLLRRWPMARSLWVATLAGLALGTAQALADGAVFLLETPLIVGLGLAAVAWLALRPPATTPARLAWLGCLMLLVLARPEGLPLALLLLGVAVWPDRRGWLPLAGLFLLAVLGYFTWRIQVFGFWAPNTYYAKTSATRWFEVRDGGRYLLAFFAGAGAPPLLIALLLPLLGWRLGWTDAALRRGFWLSTTAAWLLLGGVVWSGGDCYSGGRFLALPLALGTLALLLAVLGTGGAATRWLQRGLVLVVAVQLAALVVIPLDYFGLLRAPPPPPPNLAGAPPPQPPRPPPPQPRPPSPQPRPPPTSPHGPQYPARLPSSAAAFACNRDAALALAEIAARKPGAVVAQTDFQRAKYFADALNLLDLSGLNSARIAHRPVADPVQWGKVDLAEAARMRPELLVLGHHLAPTAEPMALHALADALGKPELDARFCAFGLDPALVAALSEVYDAASISNCGGYFNFLVRRDMGRVVRQFGGLVHTGR